MCFSPMEMPIYDCTSFYWPEELSLKNCVKVLPTKAEEITKTLKTGVTNTKNANKLRKI